MSLLYSLVAGKIPHSLTRVVPRTTQGTYPIDLEVEDGYPSEEKIEEIKMISFKMATQWLREEFPRLWKTLPYGSLRTKSVIDFLDRPALEVFITTGGWSGCEDVIDAVLSHPMMSIHCRERRSGGAYVFIIPNERA